MEKTADQMSQQPEAGIWLGNERYRLHINAAGRGGSFWKDLALTRWRQDPVEDADGVHCWLRDCDAGDASDAVVLFADPLRHQAMSPLSAEAGSVTLRDVIFGLQFSQQTGVDADRDVEFRDMTVFNPGDRARCIEVTLCADIVLNHAAAEAAHPAFSKLFVQTSSVGEQGLLASRRPRARNEHWPVLGAVLEAPGQVSVESSRSRFQGRGYAPLLPQAVTVTGPLSGTVGNVLDPVMAFRCRLAIPPGSEVVLRWRMAVAATEAAVCQLLGVDPLADGGDAAYRAGAVDTAALETSSHGYFSEDGRLFHMPLSAAASGRLNLPPMPWVNVMANPDAGLIVSEQGAGYTWSGNSREHRLTPWFNDPMLDTHGEVFYLRDETSGEYFSLTPGPCPGPGQYSCTHGQGFSCFEYSDDVVHVSLRFFVPVAGALRIVQMRVRRLGSGVGRYSVFVYQRMQLGADLADAAAMHTWVAADLPGVLYASHEGAGVFAGRVAYSAVTGVEPDDLLDHCQDRMQFIGHYRNTACPAALDKERLGHQGRVPGVEPCLAHQLMFSLAEGGERMPGFLLGEAGSEQEAADSIRFYAQPGQLDQAFQKVDDCWQRTLGRLQVQTPDQGLNRLLNHWLPYQNLSCRIWGRSAFYQSGGAFGYRDQLQDAAAFMVLDPAVTRQQILLHAAHQFVEGDVLHWWHPAPVFRGLRTRFSDDLLWLPYVTAVYVAATGDMPLLDETCAYLEAPLLDDGEDERYLQPVISDECSDVYTHCLRALYRGMTQGPHGLPLMGTGDWNDGMNRVGRQGRGESVWLGFFICHIIDLFLPLAVRRDDQEALQRLRAYREHVAGQINLEAWDGAWYLRAWYDDGTALGASAGDECRIDALVQAWGVISGVAPDDRVQQSMQAALAQLLRRDHGLLCLLAPPFVHTPHDPGYIRGYVAGVRENGGQYTHAACWFVRALAESGQYREAVDLLDMIGPAWHSATPARMAAYQLEPYVMAADIYGVAPHEGRGGWSWYTGAAGWYHRVAIETILGFTVVDGCRIRLQPRMPADWAGTTLLYRWSDAGTHYHVTYHAASGTQGGYALADGQRHELDVAGAVMLDVMDDGGRHQVDFFLSVMV